MQENFEAVMERIFHYEGGYTNDAHDPGGPTNWGITIFDARMYLNPKLSTRAPWTQEDRLFMKNMTKAQALQIYASKYWAKIQGGLLFWGVDLAMMDPAVNSGVGHGAKWLRQAVGMAPSGSVDQSVIAAVTAHVASGGGSKICRDICDARLSFLESLTTWQYFGKGWGSRVADVRARSVAMASMQHPAATTDAHAVAIAHAEVTKDKVQADHEVVVSKKGLTQSGTVATTSTATDAAQAHHSTSFNLDENTLILVGIIAAFSIMMCVYFHWRYRKHVQIALAAQQVASELKPS